MITFFKRSVVYILTWEARAVLFRYKPKIIAVTGSIGKTTTKDAIYAALSENVHIRKNEKSFNSEIGVPLVILGCSNAWNNPFLWIKNIFKGLWLIVVPQPYPQWLVLELGADRPGDIRNAAKWIRPDVVVITGVPDVPVHVEAFESPDAVYEEKISVIDYIKKDGVLVLNGDDRRLKQLQSDRVGKTVWYGFGDNCTYTATDDKITYDKTKRPMGISFVAQSSNGVAPIIIKGALGRPRMYGALAALAVADMLDVPLSNAALALTTKWEPPHGRMRLIAGKNNTTIIDDTYNSSPVPVLSALDTLAQIACPRRVAVLADMLELGKYSADAHREVGEHVAATADVLVTVGFRSRVVAEGAIAAGMPRAQVHVYEHESSAEVGKILAKEIKKGDVILVKGSQSMRMEHVVLALMADPTQAPQLLVRQDSEWKKR